MDATKLSQVGAERCTGPFARIAMHLAFPVTIVIARPLTGAVADRPVRRLTPGIAVGFISIEHRAADRNVLLNQFIAGSLIGMLTD